MLRLWVVAAFLWLALAGGVYIAAFSKVEERTRPLTVEECESMAPGKPCPRNIERLEYVRVWQMPPWWFLAGVIAGPLILLGIGSGIFWVIRGFKPPNSN